MLRNLIVFIIMLIPLSTFATLKSQMRLPFDDSADVYCQDELFVSSESNRHNYCGAHQVYFGSVCFKGDVYTAVSLLRNAQAWRMHEEQAKDPHVIDQDSIEIDYYEYSEFVSSVYIPRCGE